MSEKMITYTEARNRIGAELRRLGFTKEAADFVKDGGSYIELRSVSTCSATVAFDEKTSLLTGGVWYRVRVSWSSTYRTTAEAAVALKNYRAALDLAQELEALVQSFPPVRYEPFAKQSKAAGQEKQG